MPFKYRQSHRQQIKKQPIFRRDWPNYNESLKNRGNMTIWLSQDVIDQWYMQDRVYDGTGTPNLYSDMAILTVHEIRQVFKLPLRQCEGFINSLFKLINIDLQCPSYSVMSKRLKKLNLKQPFYRKSHFYNKEIKAIAIDSSGLKCFCYEEWHIEKYQIQEKKAYKKLHLVVDDHHIIQRNELTDSHTQDQCIVKKLISPNRNILEIKYYGHMQWQKRRDYGKRNHSELAIQRYKRILGNKLHARDFERQKQEAIIGCSILNKMMCITLEKSVPNFENNKLSKN